MVSRISRIIAGTVVAGVAGVVCAAAPANAAATPIGPNQYFAGAVNAGAATTTADIRTDCVGPVTPYQTGHPLAGQYVEVLPAAGTASDRIGYTGSAGRQISVSLVYASSTGASRSSVVGSLGDYGVPLAIPTTLAVPCSGAGDAVFTPVPTSSTAKSATVPVTFLPAP